MVSVATLSCCARLKDFAREWRRLEALPHDQRSAATDKIWNITVRTSLG